MALPSGLAKQSSDGNAVKFGHGAWTRPYILGRGIEMSSTETNAVITAAAVTEISYATPDGVACVPYDGKRRDSLMGALRTFAHVAYVSGKGFAPKALSEILIEQKKWGLSVPEVPSYIGAANLRGIRENPSDCSLPCPQRIQLHQQKQEWIAQYGAGRSRVQLVWDSRNEYYPERIRLAIGTSDVDIVARCESAWESGGDAAAIAVLHAEFPERFAVLRDHPIVRWPTIPRWESYYDGLLNDD